MMIAASTDEKVFDFDFSNPSHDFSSDVNYFDNVDPGFVGGDDLAIDVDCFLSILNEELLPEEHPLPELPINPFYPSMDYTLESVSTAQVGNDANLHFHPNNGSASESSAGTMEVLEQVGFASLPCISSTEANGASFEKNKAEPSLRYSHKIMETEYFPSTQHSLNTYDISAGCPNQNTVVRVDHGMLLTSKTDKDVLNSYLDDSQSSCSCIDNKTTLKSQVGVANISASEVPMFDLCDSILYDNHTFDQVDTVNTFDSSSTTTDEASAEPFSYGPMNQSFVKQAVDIKDENYEGLALPKGFEGKSCRTSKEVAFGGLSYGFGNRKFSASSEAHYSGVVGGHPDDYRHSVAAERKPTNLPLLNSQVSHATHGDLRFKKGVEAIARPESIKYNTFFVPNEPCGVSLSDDRNSEVDDDDVCIIEDLSAPAQLRQLPVYKKSATSHMSTFFPGCSPSSTPSHQGSVSGTRVKTPDESLIFQAVVQDLSQPKSEATPPDGVLEVPLLRHQRIALSWMVQKETTSLQCSGGILADDQGLGKTVSTMALILTERAPCARTPDKRDQDGVETLDLDEEDNKSVRNGTSTNGMHSSSSVRGRPSGGTLVVCPTSVLRQWGDELKNKVSDKAKLSVCMYHGSNRTKDPYELANYDVVLTTYSIVSMEVPKPVAVKDGQKLNADDDTASRKRKHSSKSEKRRLLKEMDDGLLESSTRPLARVNWFRVVLNEAQSIKNYRTQVAQACWGLRAKRRWCLSGTPIQNSVDDLYSYFRFLRYDPYSVYKSFCSMVKFPIAKNPSSGYKKLQAVLKTIMLRRTKGTLLDGEPIINLPPKSVKLKKVEFSEEERDFYTRLEADSRAQFQAYADSGTVKQNYVNILLMLLRLRQACDHPYLVKGYGSSSVLKSSIHAAKNLPRERQISLLNCLEASLAICGICSDPPEDAVVCICGHVFCNQCISERLTGDENQCPVKNCKLNSVYPQFFPNGN